MDTLLALIFLMILSPLLCLIALAVKIGSRGPAIFLQQRVGRDGKLFTIYKFRTMSVDAPSYSYKVHRDDPRITRVGRWLRRSGLDELPQLLNVVRGEMSLVGPRPELPFIFENYYEWQTARAQVRPGITGWWQIHHRNDIPMHFNVEYDLYYIEHMSLRLDLHIALATVRIVVKGLLIKPTRA